MSFFKKINIPFWTLVLFTVLVFWQFFFLGKLPVPADSLVGVSFPWIDYKWGYVVGVPVKNALLSDGIAQFFVWKYLSIEYWKQGIVPLWNPLSFSGIPFLEAYHSTTLLPFNLILFLPQRIGWGLFIWAQTLTAALGMYLLLTQFVKNKWARVGGSLVFCLSGPMTTWVEYGTGVWAASMLPFIFFFLIKYLDTKKWVYLFGITASFITLYLSGHAQLTLYSTALYILFIFYNLAVKRAQIDKSIIWPFVFLGLALGAAMIQLLPAQEIVKHTIRGIEQYSKSFDYGLNDPYQLIRFLAPDFFGNPGTNNHWDKIPYHEQSGYLGVLAFPLIIPLLFKKFRDKTITFWIGVFIFCLVFGFKNPLSNWIYSQPLPFLTYSSAGRIFFILSFVGGLLTAVGLSKLEDKDYRRWVTRLVIYALSTLIAVGGAILLSRQIIADTNLREVIKLYSNLLITLRNLVMPIGLLAIFLLSLLFVKNKKLLVIMAILIIFFDLNRFFAKYNPFVPYSIIFPIPPQIEYLQKQPGLFRVARGDLEALPPNSWIPYGISSIEGYDPMALEDYGRYMNRLNNFSAKNGVGRYMEVVNYPSKFLDALNVKYLIAVKRDEHGVIPGDNLNYKLRATNYQKVFEDKNTAILLNPDSKDRTYFLNTVMKVGSRDELFTELDKKNFDPTKNGLVITSDHFPSTFSVGESKVTRYSPNTVVVETNNAGAGFLVLADTYMDGWHVSINGKPTSLYQTNLALRGVVVPKGKNRVKFNYWPDSFDKGLKLSIASLLIILSLGIGRIIYLRKKI